MARQRLSNEMDMIQVIQQQRFFDAALNILLSKPQIAQLREGTRFKTIELQTSAIPEDASMKILPSEKVNDRELTQQQSVTIVFQEQHQESVDQIESQTFMENHTSTKI